jgi:hypothetical protein
MGQVRVESCAISLDGSGAGPDQDINNGLGVGQAEAQLTVEAVAFDLYHTLTHPGSE